MKPFKTIAGRWQDHATILENLSERDKGLAMMMFVSGFSAALDAMTLEIPEYSEREAMHLLSAMHEEVAQITAMAQQAYSGVRPS